MKTIYARLGIILTFLLIFIHPSFADEPPPWCAFDQYSANGKFIAVVDLVDPKLKNSPERAKAAWKISVYEFNKKSRKLLWTTRYLYDGYPDGLSISDDGKYAIYVSHWYYADASVVYIYKQGNRVNTDKLKGKDFKLSLSDIQNTASHFIWLDEERSRSFVTINNKLLFQIITQRRKKYLIDLDKAILTQ